MAWSNSKMFREFARSTLGGTGTLNDSLPNSYAGLVTDVVKVALFNNSITPDKDASRATAAYNAAASQWLTANEVTDATNWQATGRALSGKTLTVPSSGVARYDATDLAAGGTVTLTNAYGCLVYDDSIAATGGGVADQGVCFNYFGGGQTVTGGTFTIVWSANGIFEITT